MLLKEFFSDILDTSFFKKQNLVFPNSIHIRTRLCEAAEKKHLWSQKSTRVVNKGNFFYLIYAIKSLILLGLLHLKSFQKILILVFESNNTFSFQITFFPQVLAHCASRWLCNIEQCFDKIKTLRLKFVLNFIYMPCKNYITFQKKMLWIWKSLKKGIRSHIHVSAINHFK